MLDAHFHQGSGLRHFTPQSELRVMAMASQEGAAGAHGLETLWQICASLQRMGYSVLVLDGTARETDESPGLIHLLQQAPWIDGAGLALESIASSLAVLPAARGLDRLSRSQDTSSTSPLQAVLPYFRSYGVLMVHAPASVLGSVLENTKTCPLIVLGPRAAGVLQTYGALKQMVLDTGLSCMLAAVVRDLNGSEGLKAQQVLHSLQACAARHLPAPLRTTTIAASKPQDLQRLALQLLENAGTIHSGLQAPSAHPPFADMPVHLARSH